VKLVLVARTGSAPFVDSSIPPPPSINRRLLRPWYLVPTMMLTWCVGVRGLMVGASSIEYLRSARLPDVATATQSLERAADMPEFVALFNAVMLEEMLRLERVTLPLSLAQVMLAMVLVIASGLTMGSRPGARLLTIQALVANALLAGVTYALTRTMRVAAIDTVINVIQTLPPSLPQRAVLPTREMLWWLGRILVAGEIGTLALGAFALTRPRIKAYFDAVARAAESAEEP
jgi:hypothetical protein